jgi:hypothetical protein
MMKRPREERSKSDYVATYLDWVPVAAGYAAPSVLISKNYTYTKADLGALFAVSTPRSRHAESTAEELKCYIDKISYVWRTDGLLLFRLELASDITRRVQEISRNNHSTHVAALRGEGLGVLAGIISSSPNIEASVRLSRLSDVIAGWLTHYIKIECYHVHSFHDPLRVRQLEQVFVVEPIRLTGELKNHFSDSQSNARHLPENSTFLQEQAANYIDDVNADPGVLADVLQVDLIKLTNLARNECLVCAPARVASSPSVALCAPLALFRQHCRFREELLLAIQWRKNRLPLAVWIPSLVLMFFTCFALTAIYQMGGEIYDLKYKGVLLILFAISCFGGLADEMRRYYRAFNKRLANPYYAGLAMILRVATWLAAPFVLYAAILLISSDMNIKDLAFVLIPALSLFAALYGVSIVWRRQPIIELLQRGIGFMENYAVCAISIARLFRNVYGAIPGEPGEPWRMDHAIASVRARYEWELERLKREQEMLLIIVGVASALAAMGGLFGWFDGASP